MFIPLPKSAREARTWNDLIPILTKFTLFTIFPIVAFPFLWICNFHPFAFIGLVLYFFVMFSPAFAAGIQNIMTIPVMKAGMKVMERRGQREAVAEAKTEAETPKKAEPIEILLGKSLALLRENHHQFGCPKDWSVKFLMDDLCRNTIIFGGIGSGKTTSAINPLMAQIFAHENESALVFDIKGDFMREVDYFASANNREVTIIGDGGVGFNLLAGVNPELATSWLKSCFLASGQGKGDSSFWVNQACELCRNILVILRASGANYSLAGLYEAAFKPAFFEAELEAANANAENLSTPELAALVASADWYESVWENNDDKLKKSVLATASDVLSPFSQIDLREGFCGTGENAISMNTLIETPSIFFVNLPQYKYGKEGSRITYLLIKLNFMNMMRQRRGRREWNQSRGVFFICDEYQSIVDPVADLDFWDKSRSSKTMGIVSMQGLSSLYAAISDKTVADAILQNFRNRIMFRTEDVALMKLMQDQLGEHDVQTESQSSSHGQSFSNSKELFSGYEQSGYSDNTSTSISISRESVFSLNNMRALAPKNALILATGNAGHAIEDVFYMPPIYVD